jgi:cytidine kinase
MTKLTVVGSIAFDGVETHAGKRDRLLGGSAVHFSLASSFFAETRVVGPVGDDFGDEEFGVLHAREVNTDDIERVAGGKTFFWAGRYERDVNVRHTLQTDLNVFETFEPKLSDASRDADVLFLANIQPDLQIAVREQCRNAKFTALDSMNLWIDIARDSLVRAIGMVDCVIVNDGEIKQLTDEPNLVRAARAVLEMGPRIVVAKQGEYGSAVFTRDGFFGLPAYPTPVGSTRRAPATPSPAASSATSPSPAPSTTTRRCAVPWPTARRSRRSTSRPSAPSASRRSAARTSTAASPSSSA